MSYPPPDFREDWKTVRSDFGRFALAIILLAVELVSALLNMGVIW